MTRTDVTLRPITGRDELALFNRFPYVLNEELEDDLAAGRRRPEWLWVALRGDELLARVAWWCRVGDDAPFLMDVFDLESVDVGEQLLRKALAEVVPAGTRPPEYGRFIPPGWREDDASRRVVEDRMTATERTGAALFVERLRLEWRPGTPIPEPSGRLAFRPFHDTDEVLDLMTRVMDGTLDAHSRDDLTRMPARDAAIRHYEDELAHYRSPRDWWRVATLPDGEPAGFVTPARNDYNAVIGYLAVLPEHRGNGHIDDILAEGTRILAAQDVPRIRAATDVGNVPMAKAFGRLGYVNFERAITMTWP
ncbi:GNAT family N-acetyltransferase [Amycolatopsis oliviviridis]|uniref:GNAT family N-acetyltransferase n=1 Tax=Amycolatopsis oliviviridis TaxID=1471590 RepID=UPI001E60BC5C|nr:GNAT family N-acetyltransferase [Amycolatopsis oliviviridis]